MRLNVHCDQAAKADVKAMQNECYLPVGRYDLAPVHKRKHDTKKGKTFLAHAVQLTEKERKVDQSDKENV